MSYPPKEGAALVDAEKSKKIAALSAENAELKALVREALEIWAPGHSTTEVDCKGCNWITRARRAVEGE
jgi:hypothetical protein